jgi:hypothetical protein
MFKYDQERSPHKNNSTPHPVHEQLNSVLYNPVNLKNNGAMPRNYNKTQVYKLLINNHEGEKTYYTRAVKMPPSRFSSNYGEAFSPPEIATGVYTFIILSKSPDIIYCGRREDIMGHISLSRGHDVCYAGEMYFSSNGHLNSWSNDSGHYIPPANLHVTNIHPDLRQLLPPRFFKNYSG